MNYWLVIGTCYWFHLKLMLINKLDNAQAI